MIRRGARVVVVVGLVLGGGSLAACGSPHNPTRPEVQRALRTSGFSAKDAKCVTDRLFAILTPRELRKVAEKGADGVPAAKSTDLANGLAECDDTTGPAATVPTTAAPTTAAAGSSPSSSVGGPSTQSAGGGATSSTLPASSPTTSTTSGGSSTSAGG